MNDAVPKFCTTCGSRLKNYPEGYYDAHTGLEVFHDGCSNAKCGHSPLNKCYHDPFIVVVGGFLLFALIYLLIIGIHNKI